MHSVLQTPSVQASNHALVHNSLNQNLCSCLKSPRHPLCRLVTRFSTQQFELILMHSVLLTSPVQASHHGSVHNVFDRMCTSMQTFHSVRLYILGVANGQSLYHNMTTRMCIRAVSWPGRGHQHLGRGTPQL